MTIRIKKNDNSYLIFSRIVRYKVEKCDLGFFRLFDLLLYFSSSHNYFIKDNS